MGAQTPAPKPPGGEQHQVEPAKADAARQEGDRLAKAGQYEAAIEAYGRAIQIDPQQVAAYKARATAFRHLNETERAIEDYDQAILLAPEDAETYYQRGGAHLALRQTDAAIRDFTTAIEKKPDYANAYSARGGAKLQAGDKAGAEADWAKADSLGYSIRRIRVGGNVEQAKLIKKVTPVYPAEAKAGRISGVVRLNAIIAKDGTIQDLAVASGHPLLAEAAMKAVKQWVYQTTLLDGRPVEVVTQIDVNFELRY